MSEVNLLEEELLLDDKQVSMLAFAIKPQDIKNYINEHKTEYQSWLILETSKEFWEKYGDLIFPKIREMIPIFVKEHQNTIESLMLKAT